MRWFIHLFLCGCCISLAAVPAELEKEIERQLEARIGTEFDEETLCRELKIPYPLPQIKLEQQTVERQVSQHLEVAVAAEFQDRKTPEQLRAEAAEQYPLWQIGDIVTVAFKRGGTVSGRLRYNRGGRIRIDNRYYLHMDLSEESLAHLAEDVRDRMIQRFVNKEVSTQKTERQKFTAQLKERLEAEFYPVNGYVRWRERWVNPHMLLERAREWKKDFLRRQWRADVTAEVLTANGYVKTETGWHKPEEKFEEPVSSSLAAAAQPEADALPYTQAPLLPNEAEPWPEPAGEQVQMAAETIKQQAPAQTVSELMPGPPKPALAGTPIADKGNEQSSSPHTAETQAGAESIYLFREDAETAAAVTPRLTSLQQQQQQDAAPHAMDSDSDEKTPPDHNDDAAADAELEKGVPEHTEEDAGVVAEENAEQAVAEILQQLQQAEGAPVFGSGIMRYVIKFGLFLLVYGISVGIGTFSLWIGGKLTHVDAGIACCLIVSMSSQFIKMVIPLGLLASLASLIVSYALLYKWTDADSLVDIVFMVIIGNLAVIIMGLVFATQLSKWAGLW